MRNRWKRAKNSERLLIIGFSSFGVLFWIGLSALFWYFIKTFYSIEIVGPIVLRKLMELLMLSLFGMLCFSNVVTALSSFYLSDDLELLLSLPISRVQFHMARQVIPLVNRAGWPLRLSPIWPAMVPPIKPHGIIMSLQQQSCRHFDHPCCTGGGIGISLGVNPREESGKP